jgi:hypothetical protein
MKKVTLLTLALSAGIGLKSFGQNISKQDQKEQDQYNMMDGFKGEYPLGDSIKMIWLGRIESLKKKVIKLDKLGVTLSGTEKYSKTNLSYHVGSGAINSKHDHLIPNEDCKWEFYIDTLNMSFAVDEETFSNDSLIRFSYFYFGKNLGEKVYQFKGSYIMKDYKLPERGFPYLITRDRLFILYTIFSSELDTMIKEAKKSVRKN